MASIIAVILLTKAILTSGNGMYNFIESLGVEMEESGKVFLHNGMIYQDVVIALPATLKGYRVERKYRKDSMTNGTVTSNEADTLLEISYQHQLKTLQGYIPESNILDITGCKMYCDYNHKHELLKEEIRQIQLSAVKHQ